jgi:peptide/nickel transport system substrate-binding protein
MLRLGMPRSSSQLALLGILAVALAACAGPTPGVPTGAPGQGGAAAPEARRGGAVTIAISSTVSAIGMVGVASTSTGGWFSVADVHSNGLITSEVTTREPVGRLAERVPTLENGDITLLPDGRMQVVYRIRKGVTWQDGVPFTARDLVFAYQFNSDPGIPSIPQETYRLLDGVEAPDDATFVMTFKGSYLRANQIGLRPFWPQPQHILGPVYERYLASKNPDDVVNHPYWTSEYVHLGPFRLASFDPAGTITFQAYENYFLGRPKLDTVRVRVFTDLNTLYTNLLAGTVDLVPETVMEPELGFQLMDQWARSGDGTVHLKKSAQRFLSPQMRPEVQTEPSIITDVRVRAALYHALDRETLSEGLQSGHRELAAFELVWPGEQFYEATRDSHRRYNFDPDRAKAILGEVGWTPGPDGMLVQSSDRRRFRTSVSGTAGRIEREVAVYADYWKRIGLDAEPRTVPGSQVRNAEYRALYPSWEASAAGGGDEILGRLEGPAASPQNRWSGNRGGYDDPRAQALIDTYRTTVSADAQFRVFQALSDFVAAELPFLLIFSTAEHIAVRKGVKAFDDHTGGDSAARPYGTYTRNAHLWELQ